MKFLNFVVAILRFEAEMMKNRNLFLLIILMLFSSQVQSRFLGAETYPTHPIPGSGFEIVVYDDPACDPYIKDINGVTHELNVSENYVDLFLVYGSNCPLPSGTVNEHRFDVSGLQEGIYGLRIFENTANEFPTEPGDSELLFQKVLLVGGNLSPVPVLNRWMMLALAFIIALVGIYGPAGPRK